MHLPLPPSAFLDMIGGSELLLIFFVVLLLFGGEKMPEVARGIGKSIREFKKATAGVEEEIKKALAEPPPPTRKTTEPVTPPPASLPSAPAAQPVEDPYHLPKPPSPPQA